MKQNKIKTFFNKLKEAWKNPRKKAGIKLLSYFIFFFILLLLTAVSNYVSYINKDNNVDTKEKEEIKENSKYIDKQNKLLNNKHSINYKITINNSLYNINGLLKDDVIEGYLENDNNIKKIIIKDNNIYELTDNIENIIDTVINNNYINIKYILNMIKDKNVIIENKDNIKKYKYNFIDNGNNLNIEINTDIDNINSIDIFTNNEEYLLNFYN